jgi:hypothetical protein
VSDVKIGKSSSSVVSYYAADIVEKSKRGIRSL